MVNNNWTNYSIVFYNDKYYISVGPIFGYIVDNGNIYIILDNIDQINSYIDDFKNLSYVEFIDYVINHVDIFIDENLYNFLTSKIEDNNQLTILSNRILTNIESIEKHNLSYYIKSNKILSQDEDITEFYKVFANKILELSDIDNIDFSMTNNNLAYKNVLEFLANGKMDESLNKLSLMLNYKVNVNTQTYQVCGCNSNSSTNTSSSEISNLETPTSCYQVYLDALYNVIITMFGNIDFYNDWFFYKESEEYKINTTMINKLIDLLEQLKNLGYDLSFNNSTNTHCQCPDLEYSNANYDIINNYIKVLKYVLACEITENSNKIKIYGEEFGKLLPKLDFS